MNFLVEILFFLSTMLLIPVVVALLGFVMWVLLEIGGFLFEARERHRRNSSRQTLLIELHVQPSPLRMSTVEAFLSNNVSLGLASSTSPFSAQGCGIGDNELLWNKLVTDLEIEAASRLARMSLGVRIGPMLGLMGTLIPLGPVLIGLSTGNIEDMARHLVVAFSTTVLGLFVGGISYTIWLARRQWYARDLADIEYISQYCHSGSEY